MIYFVEINNFPKLVIFPDYAFRTSVDTLAFDNIFYSSLSLKSNHLKRSIFKTIMEPLILKLFRL